MAILVILLVVLAVVTGLLGVILEGIAWLVLIALALLLGGMILGWAQRRGRSSTAGSS